MIEQFDIFISYSSKDKYIAYEIASNLIKKGIKVWYDEIEIKWGDSVVEKVTKGIILFSYLKFQNSKYKQQINKKITKFTKQNLHRINS